ncbi:odorant receptor Or1-like [Schistocerca americana]|uniref:odorant receptor Or1-like n=1 Tax=Schistocerca americana TaxID=7009 RepID=UPI001F4FD9F7|nr:odorant receptor Or1-like [Schistocerca americana]
MEHPPADSDSLVVPGSTLRMLLGLWQPRCAAPGTLSTALAFVTLASTSFLALCAALKLCADPPQELEQITLCGLVASACVGYSFKAGLFVAQGGTLRHTVRLLADTRLRFCSGDSSEFIRRRYQNHSNIIYYLCQMVTVPATIGWVLCPVLSRAVTKPDNEHQEAHRQLPLPVWLPVDVYASPTYEFLYVVQSFCTLVAAQSCLSVDSFFVHMMLMVAAELEVLNCNLSAMEHTNSTRTEGERFFSGHERNGERLAVLDSGKVVDQHTLPKSTAYGWLHRQLLKNVLHHQAILRSVSLLQSAMSVSIFTLLFINMGTLCPSLFVVAVLLQRDGNIGKAMNALFSIPDLLYETVIFCIYAHIMTDQSERLMYSAFSCGWVNSDARSKRSLGIFMTVTVRPIVITVGKTCTLSKQMLIQVLNGAYGLLNLLYYLHSSN